MTILATLATISSGMMALVSFAQIYKIYHRKSTKDISAIAYSGFTLGGIIWLLYGIELGSFPVIFSNTLGAATASTILIGWFLYGREKK